MLDTAKNTGDTQPESDRREWIGNRRITGGLRRSAVRGWGVTAAGQVVKVLITVASTAVMARILVPGDYGLVAMVTALVGFIATFKDLGLSQATVQRATVTQQQVSGMFWLNVATGLVIMLATAAVAPLVARLYNQPDLVWICLAYACMAPIGSLGAQHNALLRRAMEYRRLVVRDLVAALLGAGVGVVCAIQGLGYWSLVIMQATTDTSGTAILWWSSGWRPQAPKWTDDLKPMIKFGGALTVSNLLGFIAAGLDSLIIGLLFGPSALGIYNRAQNILYKPLKQLLPPLMNVAASAFARVASNKTAFDDAAVLLTFIVGCVSSLVVAIAVSCADLIISIVLGPQWEQAVSISRVLAPFAFVEPVASLLTTFMTARGMPGRLVKWRLISGGTIVMSLFAGLPWGLLGVAAAYSLSGFFVRTPLFIWYVARHLQIAPSRLFSSVTVPLLSGAATTASLVLFRNEVWSSTNAGASLALVGSLAVVIYLGQILLFASSRTKVRDAISLVRQGVSPEVVQA